MPEFLLEIGCEEIPARMIGAASQELSERVRKLLDREHLLNGGALTSFDTPRRLAVLASSISAGQPDVTEQVTGPSASIAFKDGSPTPAATAFAKKVGSDVAKLTRVQTAKGEYLSASVTKKGRTAQQILFESLPKEIGSIYWPKNMYWRKPSERFVRPVRWLVAMLDGEVIPLQFDGILAGNQSRGHRILANRNVQIPRAGDLYAEALREAKVLNRVDREKQIRKTLDAAARTVPNVRWREDRSLLDTVVNLTEYPSAIRGDFEREFLDLAEEVLVTVMRDHQKYFAIEQADGKLAPHFLAVLNTDGDPDGTIRHGHERVLRARFNDARFFWQADQKHPLRERAQWLKKVTFQKDLGSYYEKTRRVQRLASWLCEIVCDGGMKVRPGVVHKAALLAKTDLTTELVKEFTELQGIVGGLYACAQELDTGMSGSTRQVIADAIYDHYKPTSMEDSVPRTIEGAMLSISDKADSIAGMFAIGLQPTGSKDPFALRRQANGIVKIIVEKKIPLKFTEIFSAALAAYPTAKVDKTKTLPVLLPFMKERLEFYLRDVLGYKYDVVNAVLASDADDVVDAAARAEAVSTARGSQDFLQISAAFKRIKNILSQARDSNKKIGGDIDPAFMSASEERSLAEQTQKLAPHVEKLRREGRYEDALVEISKLRPVIDHFFDKVMVMVEDVPVRTNRLALLQTLLKEFSTIADFSEIVTEGKVSKESTKP
ncbi:MAG: glycine--tRNA ligase subunit beta [Acidobacteriota bacterium]|nr:glycine--tRNA ligase subunit beta [Acidobacteriota bacterium]